MTGLGRPPRPEQQRDPSRRRQGKTVRPDGPGHRAPHRPGRSGRRATDRAGRSSPKAATTALQRLAEFVNDAPLDQLLVAGEAVALAHRELGITPSQSLLLPLADHLSYAIQRAAEGTQVGYALRWELRQIYPAEVRVGEQIVALVRDRLDIELPRGEAVAFALHLVSAQFGSPDFVKATKMTELIQEAFAIVGEQCGDDDRPGVTRRQQVRDPSAVPGRQDGVVHRFQGGACVPGRRR